jgi:hypothetical protein
LNKTGKTVVKTAPNAVKKMSKTLLRHTQPLSRKEMGRLGALKSDSTHHFFRNACTMSGSLRFSQFFGC